MVWPGTSFLSPEKEAGTASRSSQDIRCYRTAMSYSVQSGEEADNPVDLGQQAKPGAQLPESNSWSSTAPPPCPQQPGVLDYAVDSSY